MASHVSTRSLPRSEIGILIDTMLTSENSKDQLRVAYVSPGWPPGSIANGIISSVSRMRNGLETGGHSVHILTAKLRNGAHDSNVHSYQKFETIGAKICRAISRRFNGHGKIVSAWTEGLRLKLLELHTKFGLDVVEIEETWGEAGLLVGRLPFPVVVRLRGPWFLNGFASGEDLKSVLNSKRIELEGKGISIANGVSGPSRCVVDAVRDYYKLDLPDAATIPNVGKAAPTSKKWRVDQCQFGEVLFVGRFDRHKGGDVVLQAVDSLFRRQPEARLIFCGPDRGFRDDSGRIWSFSEYVDELGLSEAAKSRIEFLGQQTAEQIALLRRRAAVTVMASRWENFANTLLEAIAVGSPLVATNSGGTPEIVKDGETGLLVPPGNADAMAEAMERLLVDRDLATRLGHAAWLDCRERFDPKKIAEQTVIYYRKVIEKWMQR